MNDISNLKWLKVRQVMYWYTGTVCDEDMGNLFVDSLMALFVDNRDALNVDVGDRGEMMIRYDTDTGEVIGLEVELFETHFLKKHPELVEGWGALKPEGEKGFYNSQWLTSDVALAYACHLRDLAYQGTLVPGWPSIDRRNILVWSKSDLPV